MAEVCELQPKETSCDCICASLQSKSAIKRAANRNEMLIRVYSTTHASMCGQAKGPCTATYLDSSHFVQTVYDNKPSFVHRLQAFVCDIGYFFFFARVTTCCATAMFKLRVVAASTRPCKGGRSPAASQTLLQRLALSPCYSIHSFPWLTCIIPTTRRM
jgi:hypothetical protein